MTTSSESTWADCERYCKWAYLLTYIHYVRLYTPPECVVKCVFIYILYILYQETMSTTAKDSSLASYFVVFCRVV